MAERFSASNLCSVGRVVRMWIRILAATVVLVALSKTLNSLYIAALHPGVHESPVRVEVDDVFEQATETLGSS